MSLSSPAARPRPVVLCVLDGWGVRPASDDNAVTRAATPVWHRLTRDWPTGQLEASEGHVGLPDGQMGNSEVGHMNLGAGRVVLQDLPRVDHALTDGSLARNPGLTALIETLKRTGGTAHVMGLLSPGGVHSHQRHIAGVARILACAGVPVVVHAFLDGRDTPPKSALGYLDAFGRELDGVTAPIGTVAGRFYAMDRDKRWDRVAAAYAGLVEAQGERAATAADAVQAGYGRGETDEFVKPTVVGGYRGMADGDGLVMVNFRADRAREILTALLDPGFDGFPRARRAAFADAVGMVEYSSALNPFLHTLLPPETLTDTLGSVVAKAGLKQLRIAETEKYAHVTFFFNGGDEAVQPGEERILVPSPKVATYDLQPAMSAPEVTDKLVAAIDSGQFDLIVVNYANTDMVGHTGILDAATQAVETVDACLGRVEQAVRARGGAMLITADHGNAEQMYDPETHGPHTAHTLNPVPAVLVGAPAGVTRLAPGVLADVAPTLLELMGLPQPRAMTGRSLLHATGAQRRAG